MPEKESSLPSWTQIQFRGTLTLRDPGSTISAERLWTPTSTETSFKEAWTLKGPTPGTRSALHPRSFVHFQSAHLTASREFQSAPRPRSAQAPKRVTCGTPSPIAGVYSCRLML